MLFKSIVKINPEQKPEPKKSLEKVEAYQHPVKLQCVVCSDTFNVYTDHKCLMRQSNQEFTIKYKQIKN